MQGRKASLLFLVLTGLSVMPVNADDIANDNNESAISVKSTISPNNKRIRSILNSTNSDKQILSTLQSGNNAVIAQFGSENMSQIKQQGLSNQAYSEQFGVKNNSSINQSGKNNFADQYQSGIGNTVISIQHGNNNVSRQIQNGNGITSRITQFGNNGRILIKQGL